MQKLFDKNGMLNISDLVINNPSFKTIMEDGIVTDEELRRQSEAAMASLRRLEEMCSEEQQNAILEMLSEMGVLFSIYHNYQLQTNH